MSDDNVRHEERPIMKKAIALLVAAMLLTGLSACGGSTTADAPAKSDGTSKTETNKEEPKPQPADLTGTWKQTNSNDPSSYMEATISGDTIEVNWIGTDTKSLYWKGTYQAGRSRRLEMDQPGRHRDHGQRAPRLAGCHQGLHLQ